MRKNWKKVLAITFLSLTGLAVYAWAQDVRGWRGHMFFTDVNPQIRFDGQLQFRSSKSTLDRVMTVSTGGVTIGTQANLPLTKIQTYRVNLTPSSWSSHNPLFTNFYTSQSLSVTGLAVSDVVFINTPAPTQGCAITGARIPATDTLVVQILHATTGACTPAAGIHQIVAIRT